MESNIGLAVQLAAAFLLTALLAFLHGSMRSSISTYWLAAWTSLSISILASIAIGYGGSTLLAPVKMLGEFAFGLMIIAGCSSFRGHAKNRLRRMGILFIPLLVIAGVLTSGYVSSINSFNARSLIIGLMCVCSFVQLRGMKDRSLGISIVQISLFFLSAVLIAPSALALLLGQIPGIGDTAIFAGQKSIEIALEVTLGFGTIAVLIENIVSEIRAANRQIEEANDKLRTIAHIDPLTTAFNRHAFYGFLRRGESESVSGCVGFFDIDDLKSINDQYGHSVGDLVIRAVVGAIRQVIRAEDLIYRWGGDEFFVIMVSMDEEMAFERMKNFDRLLTDLSFDGISDPLTVSASYGFRNFEDLSNLEEALTAADKEMYRRKRERKFQRTFSERPQTTVGLKAHAG